MLINTLVSNQTAFQNLFYDNDVEEKMETTGGFIKYVGYMLFVMK